MSGVLAAERGPALPAVLPLACCPPLLPSCRSRKHNVACLIPPVTPCLSIRIGPKTDTRQRHARHDNAQCRAHGGCCCSPRPYCGMLCSNAPSHQQAAGIDCRQCQTAQTAVLAQHQTVGPAMLTAACLAHTHGDPVIAEHNGSSRCKIQQCAGLGDVIEGIVPIVGPCSVCLSQQQEAGPCRTAGP